MTKLEEIAQAIDAQCGDSLSPFVSLECARAAVEAMRIPLNLKEMDGTATFSELSISDWLGAILNENAA